jgi:hypothetical protein
MGDLISNTFIPRIDASNDVERSLILEGVLLLDPTNRKGITELHRLENRPLTLDDLIGYLAVNEAFSVLCDDCPLKPPDFSKPTTDDAVSETVHDTNVVELKPNSQIASFRCQMMTNQGTCTADPIQASNRLMLMGPELINHLKNNQSS